VNFEPWHLFIDRQCRTPARSVLGLKASFTAFRMNIGFRNFGGAIEIPQFSQYFPVIREAPAEAESIKTARKVRFSTSSHPSTPPVLSTAVELVSRLVYQGALI
jgi:hypothetical protein